MKIITLNIELDAHIPQVLEFFHHHKGAVFCLQEITRHSFDRFCAELGLKGFFAPMTFKQGDGREENQWGVAICTEQPCQLDAIHYYDNFTEDYPEMTGRNNERPLAVLLTVTVDDLLVAVTHFTWAPGGGVTDEQRVNMVSLLKLIEKYPSLVLCGDFNAPRGTEIHQALSQKLHDSVPLQVDTTLDPQLHRSGGVKLVVDGVFITEDISATQTEVISGISDHCAVVTCIDRL